ncbi:hypothetical protein Moror_7656 [Moniliophthora roreri MCA 2997]|uniref:NAD-P-binding protein n=1 Tax=Moniliophthora roreri (strain MCA 2997) TaxID=1381753 RepID=V2WTV2_MONRO|nr:hypothetical protein Moror_7656 [Moniliophthora roreri MCA 2997]
MLGSKEFNPVKDIVDLRGKVVIVTGGNRGTGHATIQHLLRGGAKVYMGARDEKKALEAIENLKKDESWKGKGGQVVWLKVDLSDPREAKKAAQDFLTKEKRLDVLVNNAALLVNAPFEKTPDGLSNSVMVNYISPYIFTETLLPLLTTTALAEPDSDVRIINLTSILHKITPSGTKFKEVDDLCVEYKGKFMAGFLRYGHSKLLEILWSKHLQKRLDAADPAVPITVIVVHPGGVDTFSQNWPIAFIWTPIVRLAIKDAERGSYTSVFAAASKTIKEANERYKGAYLESSPVGRIAKPAAIAEDPEKAEELYQLTLKFLGGIGL